MKSPKRKVLRECQKILGPAGQGIVIRQSEILGIDLDKAGKEELEKLADGIARNSVILVGKVKAEHAKEAVMAIAKKA